MVRFKHKNLSLRNRKIKFIKKRRKEPYIFIVLLIVVFLSLLFFSTNKSQKITKESTAKELDIVEKEAIKIDDIEELELPLIKPVVYTKLPNFKIKNIDKKKRAFIETILPIVLISKHELEEKSRVVRAITEKTYPTKYEERFIANLLDEYSADDVEELLFKLETHPTSIVLAQAALESGWGTSRFFLEANNIFGVWSFKKDEPRIIANTTRGNRQIYLRSYDSHKSSIDDYFKTVATSRAFASFRSARVVSDRPYDLIGHLIRYSEQRELYVQKIKKIIESNALDQYDHYKIDPKFLKEKS